MDTIVKVSYGKDSCGFPHPPFLSFTERVLDTTTNFFLIFGMFVTGLSLLYGVLKHREGLLICFLVLQSADIVLSVLSLFYVQLGLPGTLNYEELLKKWTYLNGVHELSPQDVNKFMIIFSTIFILVLLIKIYTVSCVGKCYRFIKNHNQPPSHNECKAMVRASRLSIYTRLSVCQVHCGSVCGV
ncbi:lysosomal-associated transmembrane protein 5 [Acipenser oxyrinchus oxyrinchus]|uniref:Lysosomal-associated transmembrane protein 5 n=1 Tax=Acipenser oxyrinchus oxyrinchus TaxID=40147 RepID=A0AAD8FQB0_ACIOX|nr:lysosomal-associated transmembrane protein 5 [Acipenser oxyrinchus oxyrinchus]